MTPTSQAYCFWVETDRLTSQMVIHGQAASDHVNLDLLPRPLVYQPLTQRQPPEMLLWASLKELLLSHAQTPSPQDAHRIPGAPTCDQL